MHHPDKGGAAGDFKLLRQAYEDGLLAVKRAEEAAYKLKPRGGRDTALDPPGILEIAKEDVSIQRLIVLDSPWILRFLLHFSLDSM